MLVNGDSKIRASGGLAAQKQQIKSGFSDFHIYNTLGSELSAETSNLNISLDPLNSVFLAVISSGKKNLSISNL